MLDKNSFSPTHHQILQCVASHYEDFFERHSESKPKPNNNDLKVDNSLVLGQPMFVKCGNKGEEFPALELIGLEQEGYACV